MNIPNISNIEDQKLLNEESQKYYNLSKQYKKDIFLTAEKEVKFLDYKRYIY